jgi:hypothetical protein
VTINQRDFRMRAALRRAVTAMPLLQGGMHAKAQRFVERVSYGMRASSRHARGLRTVKFNINGDWWDALFKMLSIVLVPLTVAGMGWYWTRWQQSVNDLKGMIDLVTDASPEKQKYGIAMFEYLAKNGKVPVEFLAAQIDYATTAQNKELLPMLEVAIQNASKENPEVAEAYRVALERRPARIFIHVPDDESYTCLVRLREAFKDADKAAIIFPGVRKFPGYAGSNQELRFFHAEDKERATQIVGLFGTLGVELALKDISGTEWARTNAPNSYELWYNGKPVPKLCQQSADVTGSPF